MRNFEFGRSGTGFIPIAFDISTNKFEKRAQPAGFAEQGGVRFRGQFDAGQDLIEGQVEQRADQREQLNEKAR